MNDPVNNPIHYNMGSTETIDVIRDQLGDKGFAAYCQGNITKYLSRFRYKNGVEDLRKAQWYLAKLISVNEEIEEDTLLSGRESNMAKEAKKKLTKKGKHWTPKEEHELALMYGSGVDTAQIAKALMRPEKSVQSKVYRMKLKRPKKEEPIVKEPVIETVEYESPKPQSLWEWFWSLWK